MTSKWNNDPSTMLERLQNIHKKLNEDDLDILELFAQALSLTRTEITDSIKNTKVQRNYKNVYYLLQKLSSSNLIEEDVNVERSKRRHNEKYFKLTDKGIYQLFLNSRYHGIIFDQMSVKKGKEPVSHVNNFIKNYENNAVFGLFLYPHFEKQTINGADIHLLTKLFKFVHDCCKLADLDKKIPIMTPQFSWNKVPGENDSELLTSIKDVFRINSLDKARIVKSADESTIMITSSKVNVKIKLDSTRGKAIATKESNTEPEKYEYKMLNFFSELTAFRPKINNGRFDNKKLVETPMYDLVTDIGSASAHMQQDDIIRLLAMDTKFMNVVEEVHTKFTNGYNRLMAIRKDS